MNRKRDYSNRTNTIHSENVRIFCLNSIVSLTKAEKEANRKIQSSPVLRACTSHPPIGIGFRLDLLIALYRVAMELPLKSVLPVF